MAKKPSFLERLTGALEEDEPAEKTIPLETEEPEEEEEEEIKIAPPREIAKKAKKETPPEPVMEKPGEWLPDSEGQLTIDVYQTPADIVIKSTIAGVNPDDLDITITNDMVTIKGKREKDEIIQNGDYYYQECYWGSFSRSVILPVDVEAEKAEASLKNGILTIKLPKIEKIKTKKIKVLS
ncbi:MAG: Hsp20/alpha crystallin family protein [Candidatus Portnoybacteria bacterium]|jgi:HSP20 family protein|nr:Hsp20/alpha crystallin family protein [Candidatus Portnoybacteria bacterium]